MGIVEIRITKGRLNVSRELARLRRAHPTYILTANDQRAMFNCHLGDGNCPLNVVGRTRPTRPAIHYFRKSRKATSAPLRGVMGVGDDLHSSRSAHKNRHRSAKVADRRYVRASGLPSLQRLRAGRRSSGSTRKYGCFLSQPTSTSTSIPWLTSKMCHCKSGPGQLSWWDPSSRMCFEITLRFRRRALRQAQGREFA